MLNAYTYTQRIVALSAILVMSILVLLSIAKRDLVTVLERQGMPQKHLTAVSEPLWMGEMDMTIGEQSAFWEPPPELQAHAYVVKVVGEELPLLKQREWKHVAPASLTKILTVLVAREELEEIVWLSVSEDAKKTEAKTSPLETREFVTVEDMMRLALIGSYNDTARALAEAVGKKYGGQTFEDRMRIFRERMNEKARMIGLANSSFANATGLDEEGHFSTAEDLARLAEYVRSNHQKVWEISRTLETKVYTDTGREISVASTNDLLKEFPAIIGGKTGFTDNAGESLLLLYPVRSKSPSATADSPEAKRTSDGVYHLHPNKTAVIVILGSNDRFGDGRKIIHWLESTKE